MSRFGGNSATGTNQDRAARSVAAGGAAGGVGIAAAGGWWINTGLRQKAWADQAMAGLKEQQRKQDEGRAFRRRYLGEHSRNAAALRAELKGPAFDPSAPGGKKAIAEQHRKIRHHERVLQFGREYGKKAEARARVTNRGLKAASEAAAAGAKRAKGGAGMVVGGAGLSLAALAGSRRLIDRTRSDWARPDQNRPNHPTTRAARPAPKPPARPLKQVKASVPELTAEQEERVKASLIDHGWDASPSDQRNQRSRHMQGW